MRGTIIRSTGSWYDILSETKEKYKGRLRGKFKIHDLKVTNPIAVGDLVEFEKDAKGEEGSVLITEILPRENYIIRRAVKKTAHGHLIATNVDQTILIVTMVYPVTSSGFIDRFLVSAEAFRIPAVIVFNKTDLYEEEHWERAKELEAIYTKIGYHCIYTSTFTKEGINELKESLKNKKSVISGHSGVGKSTLINSIAPDLELRTDELSSYTDKGKHTTTFAEMFEIEKDSFIIDTPGIKELGLFEIDEDELSHYFPEMRELLGQCKFHDCKHVNEPKCAVIEKVQQGEIALSRYESYLKMLVNED
jgi:ribosome biogenesis GTPase